MSDKTRLQEVYNELRDLKDERKKIKDGIKDALKHDERYGQVIEEMSKLRAEKKSIEVRVKEETPQDASRLDDLAVEVQSNEELLSDLAFNLLMKNETVEITDKNDVKYVPQFSVRFKKEA
jgi:seryl-tRNA synthetase